MDVSLSYQLSVKAKQSKTVYTVRSLDADRKSTAWRRRQLQMANCSIRHGSSSALMT